jgi:hypothetical protein
MKQPSWSPDTVEHTSLRSMAGGIRASRHQLTRCLFAASVSLPACSTELYRGEHKLDAHVAAARDAHEGAVEAVEGAQVALMQAIRERYTEEQMWAEKIRRAATWWVSIALQCWWVVGLQSLGGVHPRLSSGGFVQACLAFHLLSTAAVDLLQPKPPVVQL